MNQLGRILVLVILSITFGTIWVTADDEKKEGDNLCIPLQTIVIKPLEDVEAKRSPVNFPHGVHFGFKCQECHHEWTGGTDGLNCTTSGCHDLTSTPKEGYESDKILYFKNAYHDLCIGCHQRIIDDNKKQEAFNMALKGKLPASGPTGCIECHP